MVASYASTTQIGLSVQTFVFSGRKGLAKSGVRLQLTIFYKFKIIRLLHHLYKHFDVNFIEQNLSLLCKTEDRFLNFKL